MIKKVACVVLLIALSLSAFSQIKLDYSATPSTQSKGLSIKGLTAESANFLVALHQANDPTASPAERKSAIEHLHNRYGVSQGRVSAMLTLADHETTCKSAFTANRLQWLFAH